PTITAAIPALPARNWRRLMVRCLRCLACLACPSCDIRLLPAACAEPLCSPGYHDTASGATPAGVLATVIQPGDETRSDVEHRVPISLARQAAWADQTAILQSRPDSHVRDLTILEQLVP